MERETAQNIMRIAVATDKLIGEMFSEIEKMSDENERKKYENAVAYLMGYIAKDIIFPIEKMFPELNPDERPSPTMIPGC